MCRLFGLTAGRERVKATFWLLDSSDSLAKQSHANPDGTGLGTFLPDGTPLVEKQPISAFEDTAFAQEARERESSTFVAHVRWATGTPKTLENTHPFEFDGRLFAHNGAFEELETVEEELGGLMDEVQGDTDSERVAALITREIRAGSPVPEAIVRALSWLGENVPVYAINLVITTPTDLWAVRYPETHELWVLERPGDSAPVHHTSSTGTTMHSDHLGQLPSVVVASERLDDEAGWRLLPPGTLLHVGPDLQPEESQPLAQGPKRRMTP